MARAPVERGRWPAGAGTIVVDPDAVGAAAAAIEGARRRLERTGAAARSRAVAGYDALPPSDLQLAFGYCWGRWSQTLIDLAATVESVRTLTGQAAAVYAELDRPPR